MIAASTRRATPQPGTPCCAADSVAVEPALDWGFCVAPDPPGPEGFSDTFPPGRAEWLEAEWLEAAVVKVLGCTVVLLVISGRAVIF